jgi:LacI family transcriptional regulator
MKSKATLKEIALELGVSVSTVSKALNNSSEISEPTKLRISEFAKLKNYKPNIVAVNLKNRQTRTIGVIIPNILNSFFAKVFAGIEKEAENRKYNIITCISNDSLEKEIHTINMLSNSTVDGFIVSISEEAQKLQEFEHFKNTINEGTPIVMFDRIANEVNCDKVIVDDFESAVYATQYLIDSGCKKIGLFSTIDNLSVGKLRYKGYLEALEKNGISFNPDLVILADTEKDLDQKIATFLKEKKVDGIFALDEHSSVTGLNMGIKTGYKIPEQLSIIGFADGNWSRRLMPSLSTVSQHGPEIGEVAARLLINKIENKNEEYKYSTTVVKTELRLRGSTRN